jgi:hypothetical protein
LFALGERLTPIRRQQLRTTSRNAVNTGEESLARQAIQSGIVAQGSTMRTNATSSTGEDVLSAGMIVTP